MLHAVFTDILDRGLFSLEHDINTYIYTHVFGLGFRRSCILDMDQSSVEGRKLQLPQQPSLEKPHKALCGR